MMTKGNKQYQNKQAESIAHNSKNRLGGWYSCNGTNYALHIISVSIIVHPLHPAVQGGLLYPRNELKHPRTSATVLRPTYRIANRRPSIISYEPSLTKFRISQAASDLRMAIILRVFGMVFLAHVCALPMAHRTDILVSRGVCRGKLHRKAGLGANSIYFYTACIHATNMRKEHITEQEEYSLIFLEVSVLS